ncbi:MAG: glycosyl transferase [Bacteroidales bacterium]|nr:glycosyl transferase [Bacteroidales bacterium]
MYVSLRKHCKAFHLYIFAFDDLAVEVLKQLNLPEITIIRLSEFEDNELLRVKPDRSRAEYCWTCTAYTIKYCIEKWGLDHCIYIDADLYFYADPFLIMQELLEAQKDVLITKHNYAAQYDQSAISGKYCVQFMVFRNTEASMAVLDWWRDACIEWCYARQEDGKFGDQKYLDDWDERFDCVYVSRLMGAGVALWNARRFELIKQPDNKLTIRCDGLAYPMIFFHFHGFRLYKTIVKWGLKYFLPKPFVEFVYLPYTRIFLKHFDEIHQINPDIILPIADKQFKPKSKLIIFCREVIRFIYYKLKQRPYVSTLNTYHIYSLNKIQKWHNS